ncbi:alpha/beta hydrolase [Paenibacillus methanolicus]|uniref:S-formylglutathione hydrolase FrmB n=1 Tax=Paenibacillus methanolicus TaxID=582686 RepID=A0A5S5C9S5_9BACL|nr:alpha/beta hydrolase family protein [Paenibacillus methanolicus]TYP74743.1 S-formylglutathione hydrolase FrmB [Paenibacillus methanolicus]
MALAHVEFFAETLGLQSSIDVILPERTRRRVGLASSEGGPPYPALYLLHGASDNHTCWQRFSSIERYAADKGIVIVMPAVQYSFYSDMKQGFPYWTYLTEELPGIVRDFFPVSDRREDTFAAGLSMGGYGAFKLGIRQPDRFAAVASLSGSLSQRSRIVVDPNAGFSNPILFEMARLTFGSAEAYDGSEHDLAHVLEGKIGEGARLPKFYQACGTADFNLAINRDFHRHFADRVDLTYVETPNAGHEWSYWDEEIQHVLDWLPIRRGTASGLENRSVSASDEE